jgi:hypothetical protein
VDKTSFVSETGTRKKADENDNKRKLARTVPSKKVLRRKQSEEKV